MTPVPIDPAAGPRLDAAVARVRAFLERADVPSPCLVIDLETVRERYLELADAFPQGRLYYAVKANPAREVVRLLAGLGARFDVASLPEIELCLSEGARADDLSYGNTIKKASDIARAFELGVRLFTTDSHGDLEKLAAHAPGSSVFCRVLLEDTGSLTPFGRKFGCSPEMAAEILVRAVDLGLVPAGVAFHVGSQQLDPAAWDAGVTAAATIAAELAPRGIELPLINVGGGLPGSYVDPAPPLGDFAKAIDASLGRRFGGAPPAVVLEPGRFVVADAGVLRSEVVLVSRKSAGDEHRWVYLDVGRYNGLAETENEYIAYLLSTPDRQGEAGPCVLAGPTCDGDDVLYQRHRYELPLDLAPGDRLDFLSAGAYTASYSSVAFNGFAPLPTFCVRGAEGK
ncbi:type III PLP-dependent enzyme [Spirillospora sp. CA-294931]|uniref:type III PLP-dependent enzyme n=1 Tax=Spirillospora sp. CA-294931 TaxID=3240042 RepID=UPI003D8E65B8